LESHLIIKQISYRRDNARRDRLYGKSTPNAKVDTHKLADKVCQIHRGKVTTDGCCRLLISDTYPRVNWMNLTNLTNLMIMSHLYIYEIFWMKYIIYFLFTIDEHDKARSL